VKRPDYASNQAFGVAVEAATDHTQLNEHLNMTQPKKPVITINDVIDTIARQANYGAAAQHSTAYVIEVLQKPSATWPAWIKSAVRDTIESKSQSGIADQKRRQREDEVRAERIRFKQIERIVAAMDFGAKTIPEIRRRTGLTSCCVDRRLYEMQNQGYTRRTEDTCKGSRVWVLIDPDATDDYTEEAA